MENVKTKKKPTLKMPNTATLLMLMILVATIATYIVPAGQFERVVDEATGRTLVVADSYSKIEATPVGIGGMLSSVFTGIVNASDIIAFVFVVGGAFGIISKSGAINAGLGRLINRFSGKENLLIATVMTAFAICGATFGMAEESLPFIALLVTASLAMGYDSIVGISMVVIGLYCGYSAGPLNPFNTGIAQGIAELPLFSGIGIRMLLMVGSLLIAIQHTISYGKKIKSSKAIEIDPHLKAKFEEEQKQLKLELTAQHKLILSILGITIVALIVGVLKLGWYFAEISALFLGVSLLVGLIYTKGNLEEIIDEFIKGAGEMTTAAIFVGLSRGILVVMENGKIMDTIVYALSIPLSSLNNIFAAWGMYFVQGIINFVIPSSSGQAVVVMPVMSSLSDLIGVTRQTAVLAFQAGDGFWNMITPTHPVVMAAIGLAGIPFSKWFKFAFKLVVKWTLWVMVVLAIATTINWGPF